MELKTVKLIVEVTAEDQEDVIKAIKAQTQVVDCHTTQNHSGVDDLIYITTQSIYDKVDGEAYDTDIVDCPECGSKLHVH